MNKYNEIMSHVRVDDEMHRRVMSAVSKALDEQAASGNDEAQEPVKAETTPIRRKAKLSMIQILSIAAAALLVSGAVYFAVKFIAGMPVKEHSKMMVMNEAQATTAAAETAADNGPEVDAALGGNNHMDSIAGGNKNNFTRATKTAGVGTREEETTASDEDEGLESTAASETDNGKKDDYDPDAPAGYTKSQSSFKDYLPFKVKSVGTSTIGEEKIKAVVYTGEKGEKLVIYAAKEGTDIAKKVYPKFKGIPALLQTEGGQQFYAIDTSVGKKKQVNSTGPYDAVTWTKDGTAYMMTFNAKTDVSVFISLMEKI